MRPPRSARTGRGALFAPDTMLLVFFLALTALLAGRLARIHAKPPERTPPPQLESLAGPPGRILDRNGRPLAFSVPAFDVWIDCFADCDLPASLAAELARALARDRPLAPETRARLRRILRVPPQAADRGPQAQRAGKPRFVWSKVVARAVTAASALARFEAIGRRRLRPKRGRCRFRIRLEPTWRRCYPLGRSACHVVGLRGGAQAEGGSPASGLEALPFLARRTALRARLQPARGGGRGYLTSAAALPLFEELGTADVVTSLDADLQEAAWQALRRAQQASEADWGVLLMLDLERGDVLALAGVPDFDPEAPGEGDSFFPVTHCARFEPGSAIKPLVVALALEEGLVSPSETIRCEGEGGGPDWTIRVPGRRRGRTIHDDHYVGPVPLADVLVRSSNIGAVRIGLRGGPDFHRRFVELFRLAAAPRLGLPLPRDPRHPERPLPGSVPPARDLVESARYRLYTGPSLSFGYELLVYPLTFAQAFAEVVTGRAFRARLLLEYRPEHGAPRALPAAGPGRRLFTERTVRFVRDALRRVVADPHGTAHRIADGVAGILAGKTGTSHTNGDPRIYTASFCGFWPVARPRYLALAVLQKAGTRRFYGGRYAAPAVRELCRFELARRRARDIAGAPEDREEAEEVFDDRVR